MTSLELLGNKNSYIRHTMVLRIAIFSLVLLGGCAPSLEKASHVSELQASSALSVVNRLASGDYESTYNSFSEELKGMMSVDELQSLWEGMISELGVFRGTGTLVFNPTETVSKGGASVLIECEFTRGKRYLLVEVSQTGVIELFSNT